MVTLEDKVLKLDTLLGEKHTIRIWSQSSGDQKIDFLYQNIPLLETLLKNGFNGFHVSQIIVNAGWQEKLRWVGDNYETVMKAKGFNQSQTAKIFENKDWETKVAWIEADFDVKEYSPRAVAGIMLRKDWRARLDSYAPQR